MAQVSARASLVLVALPLLGGCHLLLPFSQSSSSSDQARGGQDRPGGWEQRAADRNRMELPPDLPPGCGMDQGGAPRCADAACPGCHEVFPATDAYATDCDKLFEDDFSTATPSGWTFNSGSWRQGCGVLESYNPSGTAVASYPLAGSSADYLVTARIRMGKVGDSKHWQIGILGRLSKTTNIACDIWVNSTPPYGEAINSPDLTAWIQNDVGWANGYPLDRATNISSAEGATYTLMLWYTKRAYDFWKPDPKPCGGTGTCEAVFCRICNMAGVCFRQGLWGAWVDQSTAAYVPTSAGAVGLRTVNRAASFDYIRVFKLPYP